MSEVMRNDDDDDDDAGCLMIRFKIAKGWFGCAKRSCNVQIFRPFFSRFLVNSIYDR